MGDSRPIEGFHFILIFIKPFVCMCSSIFTKFYSSMYCISKFDIAIFFCSQICALILSVDNERGVVIKPKLILKKLPAYSQWSYLIVV